MPYTNLAVAEPRRRRRTPVVRFLRAFWRDTSALWNEFHRPFLVFVFATIGGGFVYGWLNNIVAGNPPIPFANLPFIMLTLMVVETPIDMPTQPYLIVFWYAMPAIAVYVVGRGASDFLRLFFDRDGRRAAWEEALAGVTRNHVIVLGVGNVGLRVVRALAGMGFDVVAIDSKPRANVEQELRNLRVPIIYGDGREEATLDKANLRQCQSLCICTSNDYANLQVAVTARQMNPTLRIIARMWDRSNPLCDQMQVEVLSASELAAPAFAGAAVGIEVTQSLNIKGEDYSMLRLHVEPGSFMDGETIDTLQHEHHMDIVLHGRDDTIDVHPAGDVQVQPGDLLIVFARHSDITDIAARNRPVERRRVTS